MVLKNTFYNLLGLGLPLLVALVSMPLLIGELGAARFGILTLIWAVVSYFGLFDLGLGRALTQQLSVLLADGRQDDAPALIYSSLLLLGALGLVAGVFLWIGAPTLVGTISYQGPRAEIVDAVRAMAVAMPFIVLTTGLRGILEAHGAFGVINVIRLPMGIFTFAGPLLVVLLYRNDLVWVTIVLTIGRIAACQAHAHFVFRMYPGLLRNGRFEGARLTSLLSAGGWMTVSNVVSPLMGYLDRFLIGVTISAAAVAYYVTPNEMITRLWIIPSALTAVLFPRFAAESRGDPVVLGALFSKAVSLLLLLIFPIALLLGMFSHEILTLWVGAEFARQSSVIMLIFCFGIVVNCLAHIPFVLLQSAGKARTTAMLHVAEFVPFACILWLCSAQFGILGAACAWLLRMLVDTAALFWLVRPLLPPRRTSLLVLVGVGALVTACFGAGLLASPWLRAAVFVASCGAGLTYAWLCVATGAQRQWISFKLSRVR